MKRELPLTVVVADGELRISIGIETLACAVENGPLWPTTRVLDREALARAIAADMATDEDETGATPLMRAIDTAAENLVDDACDAIAYDENATAEEQSR